jgi:hypothetical protein
VYDEDCPFKLAVAVMAEFGVVATIDRTHDPDWRDGDLVTWAASRGGIVLYRANGLQSLHLSR